ncbi:MAG: MotA/TolQ/ExbB proton channel family protein [Puniceicoccaceae bacterium]
MRPDYDAAIDFVLQAGGVLLLPLALVGFWLYHSQFKLLFEIGLYYQSDCSPPPFSAFNRKIRFHSILVAVCPLLGLLGTVNGMLATFRSLNLDPNSSVSLLLASDGIARALVTTQIGLLLAIPGTLLLTISRSRRNRLEAFIRHQHASLLHAA